MNTVWGVVPKKGGVWPFARTYIVSLAGVLSVGFLLLVSLLVSTFLAAGSKYLAPYLQALLQLVSSAVSLVFIAVLFAMMFKWLPDAEIAWGDVWAGALVTAVLFEIGKFLIPPGDPLHTLAKPRSGRLPNKAPLRWSSSRSRQAFR